MNEPVIRQATPADAADIARIHVDGWRWGYRGQLPDALLEGLSLDRRRARWTEGLEHPEDGQRTFVAEIDGGIVGFADCGPTHDEGAPPRTAELYSMYVEEDAAGHGVGRALMRRVIADLATRGYERATLWVLVTNQRTRRFYEAAGWRADGGEKTDLHPSEGTPLHEVRYAISLVPPPAGRREVASA